VLSQAHLLIGGALGARLKRTPAALAAGVISPPFWRLYPSHGHRHFPDRRCRRAGLSRAEAVFASCDLVAGFALLYLASRRHSERGPILAGALAALCRNLIAMPLVSPPASGRRRSAGGITPCTIACNRNRRTPRMAAGGCHSGGRVLACAFSLRAEPVPQRRGTASSGSDPPSSPWAGLGGRGCRGPPPLRAVRRPAGAAGLARGTRRAGAFRPRYRPGRRHPAAAGRPVAARLWRERRVTAVLCSGRDLAGHVNEADAMAAHARALGVPAERIPALAVGRKHGRGGSFGSCR